MYKLLSEGTETVERGIYRQMPGFLKGPKLAAVVRTPKDAENVYQ